MKFIIDLYKKLLNPKSVRYFEKTILMLAILVFLLHIGLIYLQKNAGMTFSFLEHSNGYLSALSTPFSFILLYEVFLLITSLPKSISTAVLRQYQIIGLVLVRNVFKDISHFENISKVSNSIEPLRDVVFDMIAGFIIFLLIALFLYIKRKFDYLDVTNKVNVNFQNIKVFITLVATVSFFLLFAINIVGMSSEELFSMIFNNFTNNEFFSDLFTLMIMIDALLLLFSYFFDDEFDVIMRNAFFVISTILIRLALTAEHPYDNLFAIGGAIFGILGFLAFELYYKAKTKQFEN